MTPPPSHADPHADPHADRLCALGAVEARRLVGTREVSAVELVRAVLDRADDLQPRLNCFITLCRDDALRDAAAADAAVHRGDALGPLHGVPYTVKDLVHTRGVRTTYGSLLYAEHVPEHDAEAVARLRRAGAILVGKTTTSEFGAKCLTDAPLFGRTCNAWHAGRTSGGSSGGAAVAVAAGIAPLAVATDGGGSTRIPAACNGVVGLKQSLGVVPHSQVQDAFGNYTYVTPTTRSVADTALMLQVMAGEHASDPWSIGVAVEDHVAAANATGDLHGCRIAFSPGLPGRPVAQDVRTAFERALATLRGLGADTLEMPTEGFDIEPLWRVINHTSWRGRFAALAADHAERMSPSLLQQLALAEGVDGVAFQQAMFERTALFRRVQALLADHHVLAMPTLACTAPPIDQDLFGALEIDGCRYPELRANWFPWTMPFNLSGHPAITLPCGFDAEGLPIGLQLVGRFRHDAALLRTAALFEAAQQRAGRWPGLATWR